MSEVRRVDVWPVVSHVCRDGRVVTVPFVGHHPRDGARTTCTACEVTWEYVRRPPNPDYGFIRGD